MASKGSTRENYLNDGKGLWRSDKFMKMVYTEVDELVLKRQLKKNYDPELLRVIGIVLNEFFAYYCLKVTFLGRVMTITLLTTIKHEDRI